MEWNPLPDLPSPDLTNTLDSIALHPTSSPSTPSRNTNTTMTTDVSSSSEVAAMSVTTTATTPERTATPEDEMQTRSTCTRQLRDRSQLQKLPTPNNTSSLSKETPAQPKVGTKKPKKSEEEELAIKRHLRSTAKMATPKGGETSTRRQSKRLSIFAATISTLSAATPVKPRGKRSHDIMNAGSKSADAKLQQNGSESTSTNKNKRGADGSSLSTAKKAKKSRIQDEDDDDDDDENTNSSRSSETPSAPAIPQKKKKVWLTQGLYVGQDQDFDATKRPGILAKKKRGGPTQVKQAVLPLPMFTGLRTMSTERDFKLPFNVFAPSPWKCGPIHDWRKLNHSTLPLIPAFSPTIFRYSHVLIGDAQLHWKKEKTSIAKCVCTVNEGCNEDCLNRCTWMECDESNCNVGREYCRNRSFADLKERVKEGTKFAEGVEVVMTDHCGYGLRATRSFASKQIIVEYTGEIITQEESERRMIEDYKENKNYYLMLFHQNMILDATRGSVARFVNHSCDPNCRMEKWLVDGKPRMALFAGDRGVDAGEELTYDYNFNWFTGVSQQTCHCGAAKCRGALGKRADGHQKLAPLSTKKATGKSAKTGKSGKSGKSGKGSIKSSSKSQKPSKEGRPGRPKKAGTMTQRSIITSPKRKPPKRRMPVTFEAKPAKQTKKTKKEQEKEGDDEAIEEVEVSEEIEMEAEKAKHQHTNCNGDDMDEDDGEEHSDDATTSATSSPSSSSSRSAFTDPGPPRRPEGRPRITRTYKVNKTIRMASKGADFFY
ncbi:hypothetical protein RUND412_004718 [Rhizina undulata]